MKIAELELPIEPKFYGYESPIEKIYQQIRNDVQKKEDESLLYTVEESVGFRVDKEELIKALQYDRRQYQKGFDDGYEKGMITVIEELAELGFEPRNVALAVLNAMSKKGKENGSD